MRSASQWPGMLRSAVNKRPTLTPSLLDRSIAWLADRRRDPTPINTFTIYPCRSSRRTAAQWLACTFPYRRFADILADACARLGADVVCYSFIVVDLHHVLLAGLPAHLCENALSQFVWEAKSFRGADLTREVSLKSASLAAVAGISPGS